MMVTIDDMKLCIQEWFAQETNFAGLVSLCVELRLEIDKQLEFMTNAIGNDMAANGMFSLPEEE